MLAVRASRTETRRAGSEDPTRLFVQSKLPFVRILVRLLPVLLPVNGLKVLGGISSPLCAGESVVNLPSELTLSSIGAPAQQVSKLVATPDFRILSTDFVCLVPRVVSLRWFHHCCSSLLRCASAQSVDLTSRTSFR